MVSDRDTILKLILFKATHPFDGRWSGLGESELAFALIIDIDRNRTLLVIVRVDYLTPVNV